MSNNPFKPPKSDVDNKAAAPGSPLRAVLTGLAVDIGLSTLVGVVLTIVYHSQLVASGMTPDQVDAAMDEIPLDSMINVIGVVLGALSSVLGGYVCARIVRRDEYRVGSVMAALSALIGLMSGSSSVPDDLTVLLTLCTVACVLLGVKFGREYNRRAGAAQPPSEPPAGPPRS